MPCPSETLGMCMLQLLSVFVVKHRNINEWSTHCLMLLILRIVAVEASSKALKAISGNQLVSSIALVLLVKPTQSQGIIINPISSTVPSPLNRVCKIALSFAFSKWWSIIWKLNDIILNLCCWWGEFYTCRWVTILQDDPLSSDTTTVCAEGGVADKRLTHLVALTEFDVNQPSAWQVPISLLKSWADLERLVLLPTS